MEVERPDAPGTYQSPSTVGNTQQAVFGRHSARPLIELDTRREVFFPLDAGAPDQRVHGRWAQVWWSEDGERWMIANTGGGRMITVDGQPVPPASERGAAARSLDPGSHVVAFQVEDRDYRARLRISGVAVRSPPTHRTGTARTPLLGLTAKADHALAVAVTVYGGRRYLEGGQFPTPLRDKQIHSILRDVDPTQDEVKDGAARVQKAYDLARRRYVSANDLPAHSFTGPDGRHEHYTHLVRSGQMTVALALYRELHPDRPDPLEHFRRLRAADR